MSQPIKIVARQAMDDFLQNYRVPTDFFDLPDFIERCANAVTDYYSQGYELQYNMIRSEKSDTVVGFTTDVLLSKTIKVQRVDGGFIVDFKEPVFSSPYDQQNIGIQNVFRENSIEELPRTNLNQLYTLKYIPVGTNKVFWYLKPGNQIGLYTNGDCPVSSVTVYYVPSVSDDMLVPDGIVKWVIDNTVLSMKQKAQGVIVKESNDGNSNKTIETEVDKFQLK